MAQVLKDEIFERIFHAGVDVFYEKDYRSAKMQEIAERAGIPVSLIYNYYKNKAELFDKIASSLHVNYDKIAFEEEQADGLPSEKYKNVAEDYILDLLENHKIFVILMDKSQGTGYEPAKEQLIRSIEEHIKRQLASNFAEGILEVARHYKDRKFAHTMLSLVTKCYYEGVNSL